MSTAKGDVLVLRLPIPLDSMDTVREFVERVYGTGDTRLFFDGDLMRVVAPKDGWGERMRGRGRLPSASNDALRLRHAALRDGTVQLAIEDMEATILCITEIARQWFTTVGGVNYVEMKLHSPADDDEPEFVFTMQRIDGSTPHELRETAEARVAELEAEVLRLNAALAQAQG